MPATRFCEADSLEIVLVDKFVVPEVSKAEFLEAVHKSATFIRTLSGFVEGFVYEKIDGDSRNSVVTTAVWKRSRILER